MSDQTQTNSQQMIVYALIAIAVLLAVIVGMMVYKNMNSIPAPTASSTSAPDAAAANVAGQMPPTAEPVAFDAKTATKLPAGMTPEQALKKYTELLLAKKYEDAYQLLPLAQKNSYGSAAAYKAQVSQYGITSIRMGKPETSGTDVTIVTEQVTPQMPVTYTWTYTKVGKDWYAKSRAMGGAIE
jgi:hypothetical protein